jgi:hypothetical protein
MSDLQEIIVSSSIKAFNQGYANGAYDERLRILEAVDTYKSKPDFTLENLKSLITGDQK